MLLHTYNTKPYNQDFLFSILWYKKKIGQYFPQKLAKITQIYTKGKKNSTPNFFKFKKSKKCPKKKALLVVTS